MNSIFGFALILSVVVAAFSQIILKTSADLEHDNFWKEYLNVRVIAGYSLMVVSTLLAVYAYSGMEFKNGPLIETMGYPLVMCLGYFILKERISRKRLVGAAIILVGIFVFYL